MDQTSLIQNILLGREQLAGETRAESKAPSTDFVSVERFAEEVRLVLRGLEDVARKTMSVSTLIHGPREKDQSAINSINGDRLELAVKEVLKFHRFGFDPDHYSFNLEIGSSARIDFVVDASVDGSAIKPDGNSRTTIECKHKSPFRAPSGDDAYQAVWEGILSRSGDVILVYGNSEQMKAFHIRIDETIRSLMVEEVKELVQQRITESANMLIQIPR